VSSRSKLARASWYPAYALAKVAVGLASAVRRAGTAGAPRLLVYTDSRGFLIDRWYCRKNPFLSYAWALGRDYQVRDAICPYAHTTLIDFLFDLRYGRFRHELQSVDAVVLHVGIVDFSPRPASGAEQLRSVKRARVERLFGAGAWARDRGARYDDEYHGEATESLYSVSFLRDTLLPALTELRVPIVWISPNPVIPGWRGTYFQARPSNMNVILDYSVELRGAVEKTIDLVNWSEEDVRRYTVDNVHLSNEGFELVHGLLADALRDLLDP
jgi:hypothetical protein